MTTVDQRSWDQAGKKMARAIVVKHPNKGTDEKIRAFVALTHPKGKDAAKE